MFVLSRDSDDWRFPPVELASAEGLLAVGGDLRPDRLLAAYRGGIFPWYNEGQPILWWSPDPRAVLAPENVKISRSLRKSLRTSTFEVTLDAAFRDVMRACAAPRVNSATGGTWITPAMLDAYCALHERGYAHSVESWHKGQLAGGLYGVALGAIFFGESMFSRRMDASKVALVRLARQLQKWGYRVIDCQLPSAHLESLGAQLIPRRHYLALLEEALHLPGHAAPWRFDSDQPIL